MKNKGYHTIDFIMQNVIAYRKTLKSDTKDYNREYRV